ncbi:MAG: N-acetylmuramoyl-L-alanine amidase [Cyanobacteria bacterium RUI128]|nr:N-acetylmuramoyl-L-alanine amidase [Cyanobacteria bacterium RUI128]
MKLNKLKFLLIFLAAIFFAQGANALVLTHPEYDNMAVDEDGIFFSGKISKHEKVYIDGVRITPAKTGAFSYSVPLNQGENIFAVQSKDWLGNNTTKKYVITRIIPTKNSDKFIKTEKAYYKTVRDNVVLRSTPVDGGINRLGYLSKDTKVVVEGNFNEFAGIYLTKNTYGWVLAKDLVKTEDEEVCYTPIDLTDTDQFKTDKDITYTFTCSDNMPYSATVNDNKLVLTLYNLDKQEEKYAKEFKLDKFPRYSICVQNGILYLTFKKLPFSQSNYSNKKVNIVIDPGHGGYETGAVGCLGHKEKDLNLEVALKLKKILEEHNYNVKMTRETDKFVSLNDRIKFAQDEDALIFISIHQNSVPISKNPNLNEGTAVFYFNPQSHELATAVSKSVSQSLGVKNEGAVQASFAVIRPTEYVGILAELIYLVNQNDVAVYKNKKFAQTSAMAIYKGLSSYIHSELEK